MKKQLLSNLLDKNNIKNYEMFTSYYDDVTYIKVPREDFEKANDLKPEIEDALFEVKILQKEPNLIQANVGDIVLIYNPKIAIDEDSAIGIVSSKIKQDEKNVYGCRYFLVQYECLRKFALSEENYGGYHSGFLKILTTEEANLHFERKVSKHLDTQLKSIQSQINNAEKDTKLFIESLSHCKVVDQQRLYLDSNFFSSFNYNRNNFDMPIVRGV